MLLHLSLGGTRARHADRAVQMAIDQGERPRQQVAQVVGQVGVVAFDQPGLAGVAVVAVRQDAQQIVADRVGPVAVGELEGVEHVAERLAHLAAVGTGQVAADQDALRQRQAGRLEHGRPEHGVLAQDVLADQVPGARPERAVARVVRVAERGDVVDQRVAPDVGDVRVVPRQADAPWQPVARAGDRQVADRRAQQAEHLRPVAGRMDPAGVRFQELAQPVAVLLHAEEVVAFAAQDRRVAVLRQLAVDQLVLSHVAFLADRVQPFVLAVVDVARVVDALQDGAHHALVALLGGADEVVVGDVERLPRIAEAAADLVDERLRLPAGFGGGVVDLLAVLVGAGEEPGVVAVRAVPARQEVGGHRGVGVTDVRLVVHVVDRGGDVAGGFGHDGFDDPRGSGRVSCYTPPFNATPGDPSMISMTRQSCSLAPTRSTSRGARATRRCWPDRRHPEA